MKAKDISFLKNPVSDKLYFEQWVRTLENANRKRYKSFQIKTALGITQVWGLEAIEEDLETLVIFPGMRTTALVWDLDNGLKNLKGRFKIFLVEPNGFPNLSDGTTADIRSLDYGHWAAAILQGLNIQKAYLAGACFGALICLKLALVKPEVIRTVFLLNPGCLQPFSISWRNLFYNILPLVRPTPRSISKYLDKLFFHKPTHQLSAPAEQLLIDYQQFALTRYQDNTQKAYYMERELMNVKVDIYLLNGDKDSLYPFEQSLSNAQYYFSSLKGHIVFTDVAHGIETYSGALNYIGDRIRSRSLDEFVYSK